MPDFPTQPGYNVNISPHQMQGFIDSVNNLNAAINRIAGMPTTAGQFKTIRDESELQGEGEIGALEHKQKQETNLVVARRRLAQVESEKNSEKQIELLKQYGKYLDEQAKQISSKMKSGKPLLPDLAEDIEKKFQETLDKEGTGRFNRILTAVEESGIRQLRFGELPMQDILRSAGKLAGNYYNYQYGRAAERLGPNATPAQTHAAVSRAGRFLGALSPFLSTAGKFVGAADVVGDLARSYYEKGIGTYRELTASGQLTGQGTMAGFQAKYLSPLNLWQPFGRIGFGTAQEIVQNTREQGFTGPLAGRMEQGMANVISNLGIQVGQATEFFTQSMREGGMSVGQVTQEMNKFHDATFNLNMNINDYTAQILQATENLRDMGAGTAAPALAQQITAALPRAYRSPEGTQFLTGAFEKSRGVLAAMVGHGANVLNITSQRYARAGWSAMDTLLAREVQRAKDQGYTTPNDIANYLSQTSPFFEGTNVNMLQQYIQRMERGRGLGAQMKMAHAAQAYEQRFGKARKETLRLNQMTSAELQAHNLEPVYEGYGRGRVISGYKNRSTGKIFSPESVRSIITHTYNVNEANKAKRELIAAARGSHFLTTHQLDELKQANPRDITQILTQIMQRQQGNKVSVGTQIGSITVELGKQAQGLLTLVKERQHALANGSIQSNTTNK